MMAIECKAKKQPNKLKYMFSSPNPALTSAILTQMAWLGFPFLSTIVLNSYAATGNRTHGRVAPDWDLFGGSTD